jgi:ferric-dicitrate binding protein FerR (iron transport regulator)
MQQTHRFKEVNVHEDIAVFTFLSVGAVALFSFVAVAAWADARRKEREAYYRSETLKKLADTQGVGAGSALEFLHEENRLAVRRKREGQKLGGLITAAVGIGMMVFLRAVEHEEKAYLVGLIPLLVGAALLVYSYVLAPKE